MLIKMQYISGFTNIYVDENVLCKGQKNFNKQYDHYQVNDAKGQLFIGRKEMLTTTSSVLKTLFECDLPRIQPNSNIIFKIVVFHCWMGKF